MSTSQQVLSLIGIGIVCASAAGAPPSATALAARIDQQLEEKRTKDGVMPSGPVDDPTFLRRAALDLLGRIPTVAESRVFQADKRADKRERLIERLLSSGGHFRHQATFWRRSWIPQTDTPQFARLADEFEDWLAVRLRDRLPYDKVVRELLTVPFGRGPVVQSGKTNTPQSFLIASENRPENLAANSTRAFLGINLDCAQCHDHPFSRWTRNQFWQTAAFFTQPMEGTSPRFELKIPGTDRNVSATYLDDKKLLLPEKVSDGLGRKVLADWVTARDNPYFARNAVNRLWAQYYGVGLIEPLDDVSEANPPSHPELLAELERAFIASDFDLKLLTQAIVLSKTYQQSSEAADKESLNVHPRLFARMPVRGLTGEQLYDSLLVAAGLPVEGDASSRDNGARSRFVSRFLIERPVHGQRSIVQALALMNGRMTIELTDPAKCPTLVGVVEAPFLNNREKVETLFLAALGRKPAKDEVAALVAYVDGGGVDKDPQRALADVFWILLNSSEFNTNH